MARYICINCGMHITKSGFNDPYLCRDCERLIANEKKREYTYLDNY